MKYIHYIILFTFLFCIRAQAQTADNPYLLCEDTCSHVHGIDISHYQGKVYWETVSNNTKMTYVYIKATEGGDRIDDRYQDNIIMAHRYGMKVGSYHFFRPKTDINKQAANFMSQCRPGDQDLIPMIDIETRGGLTVEAFRDSLFRFLTIIEKAYRQKPLLYTGTNFYNANLAGYLPGYLFMIAQYNTDESPVLIDDRDYALWQYTGKGRVNGINGNVDKSRFMNNHRLRELRYRH